MSIISIIEGTLTETASGNIEIHATEGNLTIAAAQHNIQYGKEGTTYHDYEPLHPEDSFSDAIEVSLNIFFDGTQNNKTNTEAGTNHKNSNKENDSYTNDFTNIARGYDAVDPNETFQKKLYIEGIGTEDLEKDDVFPDVATGMGYRGIAAKAVKACVKAPDELSKYNNKKIDVLKINVYGFSRGAAAARHFLHVANTPALIYGKLPNNKVQVVAPGYYEGMEDKKAILTIIDNPLLAKHGYFAACLLDGGLTIQEIQFNFVGLYDTVASHGFYHGNDVEDLHLDVGRRANFVVQLSSDDEYRENFDLTNIQSAGLHGLELTLPGVHSDIGGSYINGAVETSVLYHKRESIYNKMIHHSDEEVQKLKKIVTNEGWFLKNQIKAGSFHKSDYEPKKTKKGSVEDLETYYAVIGTRKLYNTFDQIPLNLMFHFSIDRGVKYRDDKLNETYSIKDSFIKMIGNNLNRYVNACNDLRNSYIEMYKENLTDKQSIDDDYLWKLKKLSYWDYLDLESLHKLRNEYLHWSVKANEIGLGGRESQAPAKEGALHEKYRKREIHNG
ncbi:phospholipase effector Tle1 domain-containing protein [Flavobacterium johnsoniae]|uniref:Uncharacterized alpha/beta hydrolase domain n=1 Tax=Flavobacterium johnsoniae TaxID=986 RepID=A0A1M5N0Q7_FLAJO|nr:DUF2235 domain-containing protein [Flavobacterium johnsoniae]SHG82573.1 Uncharacterized alpha/beta hydrolase domain [Flavobacterium johnsoniae]